MMSFHSPQGTEGRELRVDEGGQRDGGGGGARDAVGHLHADFGMPKYGVRPTGKRNTLPFRRFSAG